MYNWFVKIRWLLAGLTAFAGLLVSVWSGWFKDHIILSIIFFALLGFCPLFLDWLENYIQFRRSWNKLKAYSDAVVSTVRREIPGIDGSIQLPEVMDIFNRLLEKRRVVVTGDAGVGKTGVVAEISQKVKWAHFIFIDARDICSCKCMEDINETIIGLTEYGLLDTVRLKTKGKSVVVVIDQCDSIWRSEGKGIILKLLNGLADTENMGIIVICRTEEAAGLKNFIQGKSKMDVYEVQVKELNKDIAREKLQLLGVPTPSEELIEMARNLFFLSLIGELSVKSNGLNLHEVNDRLDFWEKYRGSLEAEVDNNEGNYRVTGCAANYARLCLIDPSGTCQLPSNPTEEDKVLISRRVLLKDHQFIQRYRFRHEKLRDYVYSYDAVNKRLVTSKIILNELGEQAGLVIPLIFELYAKADPNKAAELMSEVISNE